MNLSNEQIINLYQQFVIPTTTEEYKNRYLSLPLHKNNKNWRWEDKDFPRVISLLEFEKYIEKYQFNIDKLLVFSGDKDPEIEYLNGRYRQILNIEYEKNPELYDLHNLQINKHNNFDFVCLHQILEHLYNPVLCLENIKKYMAKGGYLYINVPICNPPHSEPFHFYTGYTLMGLLCIAKTAGFKILEAGQWGNKEYFGRVFGITGERWWVDYRMLQTSGLNDITFPVIAWTLLQNIETK